MIIASSSPTHGLVTIFGVVLTAIGLGFLFVGLLILAISRRFRGPGVRAVGKIVGFDTSTPGMVGAHGIRFSGWSAFGNQIIYRPTVEFTTAEGVAVTATSAVGSNPRRGNVGEAVTLHYDPRNPQRVRVDSHSAMGTCFEAAFIVLGAVIAAGGIAILVAGH